MCRFGRFEPRFGGYQNWRACGFVCHHACNLLCTVSEATLCVPRHPTYLSDILPPFLFLSPQPRCQIGLSRAFFSQTHRVPADCRRPRCVAVLKRHRGRHVRQRFCRARTAYELVRFGCLRFAFGCLLLVVLALSFFSDKRKRGDLSNLALISYLEKVSSGARAARAMEL